MSSADAYAARGRGGSKCASLTVTGGGAAAGAATGGVSDGGRCELPADLCVPYAADNTMVGIADGKGADGAADSSLVDQSAQSGLHVFPNVAAWEAFDHMQAASAAVEEKDEDSGSVTAVDKKRKKNKGNADDVDAGGIEGADLAGETAGGASTAVAVPLELQLAEGFWQRKVRCGWLGPRRALASQPAAGVWTDPGFMASYRCCCAGLVRE